MQPVGLQEWIHKLEEGEGTKVIRLVFFGLALLGLTALWHIREADNFTTIEAMDSAQLARNIAQGRGYTTDFVRPVSISILERHRGKESPDLLKNPHPDISNAPLYPVLLAGLIKVLPFNWKMPETGFWRYQPEWIIGGFNQVLFFAALFLVFRLGNRLFDKSVGYLAVVLMALTELYWDFTTSGLSTMLLIVLFLWLVDVLVGFEQGAREGLKTTGWLLGMALYAGVLVGAMALTRYAMGWLIIPVIIFLGLAGGAGRSALIATCAAAFALALGPWVARNYSVSGTLFGAAGYSIHHGTTVFPGHVLERSMPKNLSLDLNRIAVGQYPRKLFLNGGEILTDELPRLAGNWIAALFLCSLLIPFRNPVLARLKYFLAGTILLFLVVQALGKTELSAQSPRLTSENLLVVFTPLFFLFGCSFFYILLEQIELPTAWLRPVMITGFVLVLSLPLAMRLLPPRNYPVNYPPYYPPYVQMVSEWLEPDELMMSDMPWAVAWYGKRQCVWTTLDTGRDIKDDFFRINDDYKSIRGIYLTPITTNAKFLREMRQSREGVWGKFYLDVVVLKDLPKGFPLIMAPNGLLPDQLFLTDRIRWSQ